MARRDMPYLPLYVQDFLTDEKLIECSAEATGVYIRLLCIMHKSQEYGVILLKQKSKQNSSKILEFAYKLAKQMPWDVDTILRGLTELVEEGVVTIDGDRLYQKRMVKDGQISEKRAKSGQKGGKKSFQNRSDSSSSSSFASGFACDFAQAKIQANSENENENHNSTNVEVEGDRKEGCRGEEKEGTPPASNGLLSDPELARVMSHYLDTVDPMPSSTSLQELKEYTEQFGADIVIHAIDRGRDMLSQRVNWSYIKGILRGYASSNVQTLGDVRRQEQDFEERSERASGSTGQVFVDMAREAVKNDRK